MRQLIFIITFISINIISMAQNLRPAGRVISDDICDSLATAAREKSREIGVDISFAIADADGLPRMFRRFGDALVLSATLVPDKAYTAAITRTPTGELAPYVADGGDLMGMNSCDSRITLVAGGVPLVVDGQVVGAIGVGGGTKEQDMTIAAHVAETFNRLVKD